MELSIPTSIHQILRYFLNQEYRFTIPKSRKQLAETREEEEEKEKEQRHLQSVMRFTQTQLTAKRMVLYHDGYS